MTAIGAKTQRKRLDRSAHRAEKRRCRARMLRVHSMIRRAPSVWATTDTAQGEKCLFNRQNQAILMTDGSPRGECRLKSVALSIWQMTRTPKLSVMTFGHACRLLTAAQIKKYAIPLRPPRQISMFHPSNCDRRMSKVSGVNSNAPNTASVMPSLGWICFVVICQSSLGRASTMHSDESPQVPLESHRAISLPLCLTRAACISFAPLWLILSIVR